MIVLSTIVGQLKDKVFMLILKVLCFFLGQLTAIFVINAQELFSLSFIIVITHRSHQFIKIKLSHMKQL